MRSTTGLEFRCLNFWTPLLEGDEGRRAGNAPGLGVFLDAADGRCELGAAAPFNVFRGIVCAPDEKSAEAAIAEFKVRGDMRRLIVRRTDERATDPQAGSASRSGISSMPRPLR